MGGGKNAFSPHVSVVKMRRTDGPQTPPTQPPSPPPSLKVAGKWEGVGVWTNPDEPPVVHVPMHMPSCVCRLVFWMYHTTYPTPPTPALYSLPPIPGPEMIFGHVDL